jgi:uncharacterized membrane protein
MTTPATAPGEARSLGKLVSDLSEQTTRLVRAEIDLAKEELAAKAKKAGVGSGLILAAVVLAGYAFAVAIATVILALAVALPAWLAALIVFAVLVVVAVVLAVVGARQLKNSKAKPEVTLANLQEDVAAVKEGLH